MIRIKNFQQNWLFSVLIIFLFSNCNFKTTKIWLSEQDINYMETGKKNRGLCRDPLNYTPDTTLPGHFHVKYVRVNIHFMNNSDSTATFPEDAGRDYAHSLIYTANERLLNNQKMNLPVGNNTPVLPVLYQYVLTPDTSVPGDDGIYFHYDDSLCYVNIKDRGPTLFTKAHYEKYGRRIGEVINVFLMEHHPDSLASPTYREITGGVGAGPWAKILSAYNQSKTIGWYNEEGKPVTNGAWSMARPFNHEIGHCLGLHHTWSGSDGCDDTPNNANCWNYTDSPPCDGEITNNMMDYNVCACAVTPCQIGTVHRNIAMPRGRPRAFIREDWCQLDPAKDIIIYRGQNLEWPCHKDLYGNLIINSGSSLTMFCTVGFPKGAKIIVKPGGKLTLDGATLTNRCGDNWKGIEVWQNGKEKGQVIFMNGAQLKNMKFEVESLQQ